MSFNLNFLFRLQLLFVALILCRCHDWQRWFPNGQTTKAPIALVCGEGLKQVNTETVGIRDVEMGETPWQVSVQSKSNGKWAHSCGGVVINKNFVLTTAQCVGGGSNNEAFVRSEAGVVNLPEGGWTRRKRQIPDISYPGQQKPGLQYTQRTFIHPDFNKETLANNLALIALAQPFDVNKAEGKINSICLPEKVNHIKDPKFVTGWGRIDGVVDLKPKLQIISAQVIECEPDAKPLPNQLCVGQDVNDPNDVNLEEQDCVGDYGGPLFATRGNTSTLIGIYSSGDGCNQNSTAKFIDIKPYVVWIKDNSKPIY